MGGDPQFLSDICAAVGEFLESHGQQEQCIDGSAILASVLHELGYPKTYALTVRARVLNRALVNWIETHLGPHSVGETLVCDDNEAIEMKLGNESAGTGGRWGGHLTVVIPHYFLERHALLDITIGQVNRPEFGVLLPPLCVTIDDDVINGMRVAMIDVEGCLVIYQAFPHDHTYGDWHRIISTSQIRDATRSICQRLK